MAWTGIELNVRTWTGIELDVMTWTGIELNVMAWTGIELNVMTWYRSIVRNPYHVLRRFFLEKAPTGHNLCPRAHNFSLPIKDNNNFVPRILYNELLT